ncbi:MAG: hypothetical protein KME16_09505 [Scytolyngbya sp. HA4215-MV1]|jgi:hypothetical protein|nr:hypothetical protein [Scytolyngbya sp. HA4215-MV1]
MESTPKTYPEKYWHCHIKIRGEERGFLGARVLNDQNFIDINKNIVIPFINNRPFNFIGSPINDKDQIEEIRIVHTQKPQKYYAEKHEAERNRSDVLAEYFDTYVNRQLLPIDEGIDYTNELLYSSDILLGTESDIALVLRICERVCRAASILAHRSRNDKSPYLVEDEYDVQDLLHSIIRAYIPYSVQEDPLSKIAGRLSVWKN